MVHEHLPLEKPSWSPTVRDKRFHPMRREKGLSRKTKKTDLPEATQFPVELTSSHLQRIALWVQQTVPDLRWSRDPLGVVRGCGLTQTRSLKQSLKCPLFGAWSTFRETILFERCSFLVWWNLPFWKDILILIDEIGHVFKLHKPLASFCLQRPMKCT